MKIRDDLIINGKSGIEKYPGYLPKLIRVHLFGDKRTTWKGIIKKLDSKREIMGKIKSTKHADLSDEIFVKELEDWLVENPEYSFLVEY